YFSLPDADYAEMLDRAPSAMLPLLSVGEVALPPYELGPAGAARKGFRRSWSGLWLLDVPAGPRAVLMDRVEPAASAREAAALLAAPAFDPWRTALVDPRDLPLL